MFADNQKMVRDCLFAVHLLGLAVFRALKFAAAFSFTGLLGNENSGISESAAEFERDMATARHARPSLGKGWSINLNCEQGGDCDKHSHGLFSFSFFAGYQRVGGKSHHGVAGQCKIILF